MPTRSRTILTLCALVMASLGIGSVATAQDDACERDPKHFSLKIKVKDDTPVEVVKGIFGWDNANTLHVCRGDTIDWKIQHSNDFLIRFGNATPVDGKELKSSNGKISTTVRDDAERGESYKYDIAIDGGGEWDPILILD